MIGEQALTRRDCEVALAAALAMMTNRLPEATTMWEQPGGVLRPEGLMRSIIAASKERVPGTRILERVPAVVRLSLYPLHSGDFRLVELTHTLAPEILELLKAPLALADKPGDVYS
jgi:hypothetical protein